MVLAAAKAFSASSVAITDIRPDNLPVAKQLGARHALDQSQATSASDTVEALKAVFAEGPDIVIDCVGFESTITVSLPAAKPITASKLHPTSPWSAFYMSLTPFENHTFCRVCITFQLLTICKKCCCKLSIPVQECMP